MSEIIDVPSSDGIGRLPVLAIVSVLQVLRSASDVRDVSNAAVGESGGRAKKKLFMYSQDQRYITTAGSKGYCALKEMLQNGKPGHTTMVESHDLTTVDEHAIKAGDVYFRIVTPDPQQYQNEYRYIVKSLPSTIMNLSIFSNTQPLPRGFLQGCTLKTLDLSPLSHLTKLSNNFLQDSTGLISLDLTPFAHLTKLPTGFLLGCTGLAALDLSPLTNLKTLPKHFVMGCTGLTSIVLPPLTELPEYFLTGSIGLTTIDLTPLAQITKIPRAFLGGCTGLTSIDFSALSNVTEINTIFMQGCSGVTSLDLSPMSNSTFKGPAASFLQGCTALKTLTLCAANHKKDHNFRALNGVVDVVYV